MNEKLDYTDQKVIDCIVNHFALQKEPKAPKYRICWLGHFIKTRKGKTVWETPGRARSAWINHVRNSYFTWHIKKIFNPDLTYLQHSEKVECDELIEQHLAAGLVTFPEVE